MKNENSTPTGVRTGYTRVVVMILLLVLLTQVLGDDRSPRSPGPRRDPVPAAQKDRIAGRLADGYALGSFRPSLEMKENADFFLTPALLVQEAICDDIIMTYPTE